MRSRSSNSSSRINGSSISSDDDKDKSETKLPKSFLGKIVALFFLSLIIYAIYIYLIKSTYSIYISTRLQNMYK